MAVVNEGPIKGTSFTIDEVNPQPGSNSFDVSFTIIDNPHGVRDDHLEIALVIESIFIEALQNLPQRTEQNDDVEDFDAPGEHQGEDVRSDQNEADPGDEQIG